MIDWSLALKIEHEVSRIITQQEINGWQFDVALAKQHMEFLNEERDRIYKSVRPLLVPEIIHNRATVESPYNADGSLSKRARGYLGNFSNLTGIGPFTPVSFVDPDLGSRPKLMAQLARHGWKPLEYTEKGNPKLTEESMEVLEGGIGHDLAKWYVYTSRYAQLGALLQKVRPDGRVEAQAITCGTPTARMRHRIVVNIPKNKPKVIFGKEMRQCFTSAPGTKLVGYDASGLELRLLAHFMGDDNWTHELLEGDIHQVNADLLGVGDREIGKTFIYAFIYGAGDEKIASILNCSTKQAKEAKAAFLAGTPALTAIQTKVKEASKKGWLLGIDGRKIPVDSQHKALNRIIQSAGAIVMKMAMIYVDKWVRKHKLTLNEVKKVGDQHDESQSEVKDDKEIIELFSNLGVQSIIKAGEYFKLRCPLNGEVKVGNNWSETH